MIVGKIVERSASSPDPTAPPRPPSAGSRQAFPPALHRSQRPPPTSRFNVSLPKAGESSRSVLREAPEAKSYAELSEVEKIRQSVDEENNRRVAEMSREEREEEARELRDRFGPGLEELMRKRRQKRLATDREPAGAGGDIGDTAASTLARERQKEEEASNEIRVKATPPEERELESAGLERRFGSATIGESEQEDLKAKYFPDLPSEPEKMAWMRSALPSSSTDSTAPRFDLSGRQLSLKDARDMPTDIGLHHHGTSPELAGYTVDDILHLCRSTVPSQRITMMGALAGLMRLYVSEQVSAEVRQVVLEKGLCEQAINRAVGAILVMSKSAGVFRAAIDLFYETLGGNSWTWMDHHLHVAPFAPGEKHVNLSSVAWEDVVPTFGEMLATDALSPRTTTQILRILRRLAVMSEEHCELVTPLLPEMVRSHVVLRAWPTTETSISPSTEVLALMSDIIVSSRQCAAALVDQGIIEPLLKFPLTLTWDDTPLGRELSRQSIGIIASMARYGLATSIAKSGAEPLDRLRDWLAQVSYADISVEYLHLLRTWTVCATDPHRTTPEHDLTWAQVSAMGWTDDVLAMMRRHIQDERWEDLAAALDYLAAWLEGSEVNEVEKGAEQKQKIRAQLQEAGAIETVLKLSAKSSIDPSSACWAGQIFRIHSIVGDLLSTQQVQLAFDRYRRTTDPVLRYWLLRVVRQTRGDSDIELSRLPFELLRELQPGSEPLALDVVDMILRDTYDDHSTQLDSLPSDRLQILRPLLQYTVLPDLTNVIGPDLPRTEYLKATSTLRPAQVPSEGAQRGPGLPLGNDWFFSPLDELLRSATSPALAQTPPDWDPKEIDLVRATLLLASIAISSWPHPEECLNRSELLFNLTKVFMLEHGQQTPTNHSETDLFRDPIISSQITRLIALTTSQPPTLSSSLEGVCKSFLGPDTPFFQWYTDFLALYEGISFGDHAFTQLLLPPLAMAYPVDFRQLFWGEHTSIMRGIKLVDGDVPLEDPRGVDAFLTPIETDQAVLDGMVRAAARGWLRAGTFPCKLAVHHLASNVWGEGEQADRKRLLVGMLSTCPDWFVKEVFEHTLGDEADRTRRKARVEELTGPRGVQRLANLS